MDELGEGGRVDLYAAMDAFETMLVDRVPHEPRHHVLVGFSKVITHSYCAVW